MVLPTISDSDPVFLFSHRWGGRSAVWHPGAGSETMYARTAVPHRAEQSGDENTAQWHKATRYNSTKWSTYTELLSKPLNSSFSSGHWWQQLPCSIIAVGDGDTLALSCSIKCVSVSVQWFTEESDDLWMRHCKRDFKRETPQEYESWREMYLRLHDEREERLKMLTQNITSAHANKPKGRQRFTKVLIIFYV